MLWNTLDLLFCYQQTACIPDHLRMHSTFPCQGHQLCCNLIFVVGYTSFLVCFPLNPSSTQNPESLHLVVKEQLLHNTRICIPQFIYSCMFFVKKLFSWAFLVNHFLLPLIKVPKLSFHVFNFCIHINTNDIPCSIGICWVSDDTNFLLQESKDVNIVKCLQLLNQSSPLIYLWTSFNKISHCSEMAGS